ncbi:response regulator transcription factor [Desulfosarcina ovata]|uniref:Response regulatory domain-containing protein n=1 Tax=Desulfosarcina ovata subsp. ovata TaxID=2752305 RepID=A0A5K8A963_9BACT|nr:response regulator [Desulfosarcina ovata]BBO89077.1 hypothetical protein DSCOOX_22570 [Desulfosarcina ovata subsp. ovata]
MNFESFFELVGLCGAFVAAYYFLIGCLSSDMIMDPGINGRQTYEKIIELKPNQKAIVSSGFAETEDVKKVLRIGAGQFIKKPFTISLIGKAIKRELYRT